MMDLSLINEDIEAKFRLTGKRAFEFRILKDILKLDDDELIKKIFERGVAKEFEFYKNKGRFV